MTPALGETMTRITEEEYDALDDLLTHIDPELGAR
jgi:hypothetical protein